jgi:DNA processing protein
MPLVQDENRYIVGEDKYWVAWSRVSGVGVATIRKLSDHFGGLEEAWKAKSGELLSTGLHPKIVDRIVTLRADYDPDRELESLEKQQITVLTRESPDFPFLLSQTDDAPAVLYLKGELSPLDDTALGVVGTRKATTYGKGITQQFVEELAQHGVTIVSGLARGIDTWGAA